MAQEIVIPRLGWSMEEGTFVRWLKKDGDHVRVGEAIFELDGEKASQEIEAVDQGILRIPSTAPKPGSVLKVGAVIGYLVAADEPTPSASTSPQVPRAASSSSVANSTGSSPIASNERTTFASPRARRIAAELGIDWKHLSGTGVGGRIREQDIRAAAARGPSSTVTNGKGLRIPITGRRRAIAQRMVASRQQTVPVTLTTKADATNLVNLREQWKAQSSTPVPSFQDIITKLVAEALKRHPLLAGRWTEDSIVLPAEDELHLGMAVDTEDGLLVPVIRNVAGLTLSELAAQSQRLADQARAGTLAAADMQGGVFTITNLGALGIDAFTPIINVPEMAILGLGAIRREPVVQGDGQIVARQQISLSLTFDHRIVDGAPAARFLQTLVTSLLSIRLGHFRAVPAT